MIKALLDWLLRNATFQLYTADAPIGKPLGGHNVPNVRDKFIILDIRIGDKIIILGYFQASC